MKVSETAIARVAMAPFLVRAQVAHDVGIVTVGCANRNEAIREVRAAHLMGCAWAVIADGAVIVEDEADNPGKTHHFGDDCPGRHYGEPGAPPALRGGDADAVLDYIQAKDDPDAFYHGEI